MVLGLPHLSDSLWSLFPSRGCTGTPRSPGIVPTFWFQAFHKHMEVPPRSMGESPCSLSKITLLGCPPISATPCHTTTWWGSSDLSPRQRQHPSSITTAIGLATATGCSSRGQQNAKAPHGDWKQSVGGLMNPGGLATRQPNDWKIWMEVDER